MIVIFAGPHWHDSDNLAVNTAVLSPVGSPECPVRGSLLLWEMTVAA
ncbi:hypothetical protein AS9A_3319 [Hoyosella subflava DQS3-9A1]|uniref:Uncharacterized protein n=1 Tax=Hoyosella subflava (strain DSM 45089 / JCM 17490 / NBRC 109087 / DQS3-9A1) TaxID=443218 RepID=F6EPA2_HOYSD|nr:hypothetical protein AS9A_3319 [Hoyosella subflava DQS3-9A1]